MNVIWGGEGEAEVQIRALDPLDTQIGETAGRATAIHQGSESSLTFRGLLLDIKNEGTYTLQWRIAPCGTWETMKIFPIVIP
jgi:hypothetical protein